nr:RecName: Full=Purple acid phosphatase isozyme LeSAP1 [Solanum lycopersicum]
AGDVIYIVR